MSLRGPALNAMIQDSIGSTPLCIYDVVKSVFGEERLQAALKQSNNTDPELLAFIEEIYTQVDECWRSKGVTQEIGPYVKE